MERRHVPDVILVDVNGSLTREQVKWRDTDVFNAVYRPAVPTIGFNVLLRSPHAFPEGVPEFLDVETSCGNLSDERLSGAEGRRRGGACGRVLGPQQILRLH